MNFIPADEHPFFIWFFDHYTKWSLKRRFKQVWVKQDYVPKPESRTVYFLNHNSWWDGLIPLYLNRHFLQQNARALMEDKQMRQYSFFSKIGAFSINLEDPRSSLISLRYALESMERDQASLFVYPEGTITPPAGTIPKFKDGLAWLYTKTTQVDYVPITIYSHSMRSSKPELYLAIGDLVDHSNQLPRKELTHLFQHDIYHQLNAVKAVAGSTDLGFSPQF